MTDHDHGYKRLFSHPEMIRGRQLERRKPGQPRRLPLVLPLVLYNGRRRWTAPTDLAEGYVVTVVLEERVDGRPVTWSERRLVVRSVALADRQARRLDGRLDQALAAIDRLDERKQGKKILDAAGLTAAALERPYRRRLRTAGQRLGWTGAVPGVAGGGTAEGVRRKAESN